MKELQQLQFMPPSPPVNFGMPTQLNAPNTAQQLPQATMQFDGLQLDYQLRRRLSMPGQLNLVSPPHSPLLHALANAPLETNPPQAHINVPAPIPRFEPRTTPFPVSLTSIPLCSFAAKSAPITSQ